MGKIQVTGNIQMFPCLREKRTIQWASRVRGRQNFFRKKVRAQKEGGKKDDGVKKKNKMESHRGGDLSLSSVTATINNWTVVELLGWPSHQGISQKRGMYKKIEGETRVSGSRGEMGE